jgi:MFS family permease
MVEEVGPSTISRIAWRFMPILLFAYLVAYIDRVNVGFAALTANQDLGLSPVQYGFGAGLLFLGYCGAQVPSNVMMLRVGPRRWFARIMISMGIVAAASALVVGPRSFYAARFALGVAEAGLLPGVIYFMRCWFPRAYRARYIAIFLLAIPLSSVLGSPISGALLGMNGWFGLRGWHGMYIIEGIPCVIAGLLILGRLTESPAAAEWLSPPQRRWLQQELSHEEAATAEAGPKPAWWALVTDPRVLTYGTAFFGITAGSYGLTLWLPLIVKGFGLTDFHTGLVVSIPFAFGCVATILWARHSDLRRERVWHTALPALLAAFGLGICVAIASPVLTMVALTVAAIGIFGIRGPYFALQAEEFSAATAAPGIAWIDTFAASGGFFGPLIVGWLKGATGSFTPPLLALALLSLLGAVIVLTRAYLRARRPLSARLVS